jgi:hypothetical protein
MWAFGHTHDNCFYYQDGKLIVANQKGYDSIERVTKIDTMVIEAKPSSWERVEISEVISGSHTENKGQERKALAQKNTLPRLDRGDEPKKLVRRLSAAWRRLRR